MSSHPKPEPVGDVVGASVPKPDAREKVTGRAVYTDDLRVPGMLHGVLLGSPHAHARILSYDTSLAKALPGVRAVLTAEDLPPVDIGAVIKDQPLLARGKVRYVGEPVAAVAAVDPTTARRALELIRVQYEVLPPVFDAEAALRPDAPVLHAPRGPGHPNAASHIRLIEGEPDGAWAKCDVIIEDVYETPAQQHIYLEPCSTLAEVDPDTGRITLHTSTQTAFRVQAITAEALAVPMSRIRVLVPRVGGAFGGKVESTNQPITAALALATGAPVKMTFSRTDDMTMMRSRHGARIHMRTGATRDGRILARQVRIYFDTGAYADDGPFVANIGSYFARGPYRIPHVDVECWCVYTNKLRAGAFRGFGNPQIHFASEVQVDRLAEALGMDPIELRLRNALETGEKWLGGAPVESGTLHACLERAREVSDWQRRRQRAPPAPGKRRGIGMAAVAHVSGLLGSSATVRINEDGSVNVSTGAVDTGQGSDTALAQVAAGALGVPLSQLHFSRPDTDTSPYDWCTGGTRTTFTVGHVITQACEQVREQLFEHASAMLQRPVQQLELRPGGHVGVRGEPGTSVSFGAISGYALYVAGGPILASARWLFPAWQLDTQRTHVEGLTSMGNGFFVFAAQVAEVEVDELTGHVEVLEAWSVHDVGRVINPAAAEGQIQGGFVQGLGYALTEELLWKEGHLLNPTMGGYKVPGALDVPRAIHSVLLEHPAGPGPFGAKGVAEVSLVGVAPAICNAIRHATGANIRRIPATGERVLRELLARETQGGH
ncbi:xanthine dehydrogenase family protein molybdopterin-binding subunit [Pyxidicoccus fallax]|uniref:Xanthine dehydrogenase family protein molybdopterin-binding subunit n=1 Tax=Pyxidicoccus fallax TaxID=394095 RepID=A0A848LDV8_9BACT|nr:xanthine dehydrogenase family protein molybdopterin-binding subunit [Pyxidicoccus fallax]NMO16887.1 xanthine dehydrogenase family protein molybdopterin-binding subunit [Pyxidicoccus fallax]NPC82885.1 xanthine dehydrogenase family protein molybdopterin-binding subunit [Pyxidicoccus fallax]